MCVETGCSSWKGITAIAGGRSRGAPPNEAVPCTPGKRTCLPAPGVRRGQLVRHHVTCIFISFRATLFLCVWRSKEPKPYPLRIISSCVCMPFLWSGIHCIHGTKISSHHHDMKGCAPHSHQCISVWVCVCVCVCLCLCVCLSLSLSLSLSRGLCLPVSLFHVSLLFVLYLLFRVFLHYVVSLFVNFVLILSCVLISGFFSSVISFVIPWSLLPCFSCFVSSCLHPFVSLWRFLLLFIPTSSCSVYCPNSVPKARQLGLLTSRVTRVPSPIFLGFRNIASYMLLVSWMW